MFSSLPIKQAISRSLQLRQSIGLVWKSAPGWTLLNIPLVIAQGLLPLASLYLIRQIIDGVTNEIPAPDPKKAFYKYITLAGIWQPAPALLP